MYFIDTYNYILGIKYYNNYSILYIVFIHLLFGYNIYVNHNFNILYKYIQFYTQYLCGWGHSYNTYIYETYLCRKNIKKCLFIFSFVNLFLSILYSVIECIYIPFYNNLSIYNTICNFVLNIYGVNIILFNFLIFYICFAKILQDIINIHDNILNNNVYNSIKYIIELKYNIHKTVDCLEYIFNIFAFTGIIILSIYFTYFKNIYHNLFYTYIIFQLFIQSIGHTILLYITYYKDNIYKLIHNKYFINNFIVKFNRENLEHIFNIELNQEYTNEILLNSIEDNYKSIEWLIYNELLNNNWIKFSFMGFDIHNIEFVKKMILTISVIIYIYKFII